MQDVIKEKVFNMIALIMKVDKTTITATTTAKDIPSWDSLKHMRLIMTLEKEFGIKFKPKQIAAMANVGAIIDYCTNAIHSK